MAKFAQNLIDLRLGLKLSQLDLSKATGLSQSAIARWELSKSQPTVDAIIALCRFFDVSADYLLGLTDY